MATSAQINSLTSLYVGYFDRAPDPAGLQGWINAIDAGVDIKTIAGNFATSAEATALYPYLETPGLVTPTAFVESIYLNLFNRTADTAGRDFWVEALNSGAISPEEMILEIIGGAQGSDQTILDNKIEAGLYFAQTAATTTGYAYEIADAKSAIDGVTEDAATVTTAKATTDTAVSGGANVGETFTLTTGSDNIQGTAENDVINGFIDETLTGVQSSLNIGDVIDGGAGIDTLRIVSNGDGSDEAAFHTANITNVERLQIVDTDEDIGTVNLAGRNFEHVELIGESDGLDANNVALGTAFKFTDTEDNHDINYVGTSGSNDVASIEIAGTADGENVGVDVDNVETINLSVTSDAEFDSSQMDFTSATELNIDAAADITQDAPGLSIELGNNATINVTGAGDVDLATLDGAGAAVDLKAATATGNISVIGEADTRGIATGSGNDKVTTGAITTAVDLGAGDDTFSTGGLDFGGATAVDVDAGAGTDTINVDDGAEFDTAAVAHFKNFEILDIGGGQGSYDADLIALEAVEVNADLAGAATVTDLTDEAVRITATTSAALTLELEDASGSSDTQSFTIEGAHDETDNDNDLTVSEVVTAGIETVTVVSNTAAENTDGAKNTLSVLATDAGKAVITGDHVLEISDFQDDTSGGVNTDTVEIDASGSAGLIMGDFLSGTGVSLIGSDAADTLLVGNDQDGTNDASTGSTINAGLGGDVITIDNTTVGTGTTAADTLIIDAGDSKIGFVDTDEDDAYDDTKDEETFDVITGFQSNEDTIDLGSFGFTGQKASGLADASLTAAEALELVDGTTSEISDFFVDTGVQRGVATVDGIDASAFGGDTGSTLVFIDSDGDGSLNTANDDMIVLSGTSTVALADFGF